MGVNAVIDNASSQQMAVAASRAVAVELKGMEQKDLRDSDKKVSAESDVSKLVQEGTNPSKAGMNILISLAGKLSTLGVSFKPEKFSGKAGDEAENELNQLLGGEVSIDDIVELRNAVDGVGERKEDQGKQQQKNDSRQKSVLADREVQGAVREYASLYSQYTVSHSPEVRKKLEKLEAELKEKGVTARELNSIKTAASNSIRKELAQQVRDAFMKKILSPEKSVEMVVNEKSLNDILDFSLQTGVHDDESLQELADHVLKDTASAIKDLAREKIEEKLIGKHISADEGKKAGQKEEGELKDLLKLAAKAGLDLNEFTQNWQVKKFDLGLFVPDFPLGQGGAGAGADSQQQNKGQYEFTQEDEKDLQTNRLRAVYMHRALAGDWKTMLETSVKMRKLKNGLIRLGVSSNEFERIEKEGRAAARLKLIGMLRETLEERATLYELAGPAFKLIEQKIKGLLSNLARLDFKMEGLEFESLRDSANLRVFDAAKQEFLTLKDMVRGTRNPSLEKRYKLVLKLMRRLKEESKIPAEIPEEDFSVKEAA